MSLKSRITELAKERNMSIAELERDLKFSNGSINKWDKQSPSSERLKIVADYFNVSTDYLLDRKAPNRLDIDDENTIMTFEGRPIPKEDLEIIKRLLRRD